MGNDPYKNIGLNINEEHINEVLEENKKEYINCIFNDEEYLSKDKFNRLIGIEDDEILNQIFDIFANKKDKIYYKEFITFYVSFTNENLKNILISFLLFGKNDKITMKSYFENLQVFINIDKEFNKINNKEEIEKISIDIITDKSYLFVYQSSGFDPNDNYVPKKEKYVCKKDFIYYLSKKNLNISFVHKLYPSSLLFKEKINHDQNYICDCLLNNSEENINNYNIKENLDNIEKNFLNDKLVTKEGRLTLKNLEKLMKIYLVDKKLSDIIIEYFNSDTMKDSINFLDFKNLMFNVNYSQSIENKKAFLFKMILIISNQKKYIKGNQLIKILKLENKDFKLEENIDLKLLNEIKDPNINKEIENYISYMKNLGLIPYIRYNLYVKESELKKVIINFILGKKTAEEYLIENFDNNEKFYPINIKFWNSLINQKNPIEKIENSLIAEKDEIYYLKKNDDKNNKTDDKNKNINSNIIKDTNNNNIKKQDNKVENINNSKNEKKDKKKNIKEKEQKKKESIKGKLKKEVKYGIDYVIICGEIYKKISQYFEFDYLIELEKTTIYYKSKKEIQKENEENKQEEKNEIEIEEAKLEINIEQNYMRKKENKKNGIKEYFVDFYPIKIIEVSFSHLNSFVEKKYDELEESKKEEELKDLPKNEKNKKIKERKEIKKYEEKILNEYNQEKDKLTELYRQKKIDKIYAKEKLEILYNRYISLKKSRITEKEYFTILNNELNNILSKQVKYIKKLWKNITTKELNYYINDDLEQDSYNLIYYTLDNNYFIPGENELLNLNKIKNDFVLIIIDKKNEEGKTYLSILKENEKLKGNNKLNISKKINFNVISKEELDKIEFNIKEKEKEKEKKEKLAKEKLEKIEKEKRQLQEKRINPPYGIPNFGNTCYFNSVNQIIINLPIIQKLFTDKSIRYMINKENKFGYKGKLITDFISLYNIYPYQIEDNVKNLKYLVGKLKNVFNNKRQQDAHEYLNFVLEGLHEELNLKSSKIYIEDNDESYKYNTEEELGNISWANNLRRNASFIDSIFMLQLKSNLICKKCGTKKVNFENGYVIDLPLSLCKMVTVHINLYRLPFKYKVYYDKIDKKFDEFAKNEENKNKKLTEILMDYYKLKLNFEEKKEHSVCLYFEIDYEREKSIGDLIKFLRNIPILSLEPENYEMNNENDIDDKDIKEDKIKHFTDFLAYTYDQKKIIKNDMILDKFVDTNDKMLLNLYEVLNTNGLNLINDKILKKKEYNLLSYKFNIKKIQTFEDFRNKIKNSNYYNKIFITKASKEDISQNMNWEIEYQNNINNKINKNNDEKYNNKIYKNEEKVERNINNNEEINSNEDIDKKVDKITDNNNHEEKENIDNGYNILSLNDKISYIETFNKNIKKETNNISEFPIINIISEYIIPIVHHKREIDIKVNSPHIIFSDFSQSKMSNFPNQFLVINNSPLNSITSRFLYNYIWDYNSLYMNHPNKSTNEFWFNQDITNNSSKNYKKCYPFIIRIVKQNKKYSYYYKCANAKCHWYNFCIGCILIPNDDKLILEEDNIIFIEWCNSFIKEEIETQNFDKIKISNEDIDTSIQTAVKNNKNNQFQSINDCFELFFTKESLEDPLSCRLCKGPQNFIKNYEINKLPYVLILSLKRFKYNENNNFKLKQLITYPIDNFKLKDEIYNLYGVIYHYGGINSGHYTCAIRKDKKWILCDDNKISEIEQNRVMNSYAYILFYISEKSIDNYSYYNCMKSIFLHMDNKGHIFKDNNFFKGEPIKVKSKGIGYVLEDYREDFIGENIKEKDDEKNINNININKNEIVEDDNKKIDLNRNNKKDGFINVKFELIKENEKINKDEIEKLILIDEQKNIK